MTDMTNMSAMSAKKPDYYVRTEYGTVPVREYAVIIVGSGAAGFGCAVSLSSCGCESFAIVTEGRKMGTSRNTGSDKQTYYKLSDGDRAEDMAAAMAAGGSMHGDLAYVEAVGSIRGFHRLTSLGVPFPHNEYGEYTGYRTDHDTSCRATSCGPLTSKYMTEALEAEAEAKKIPLYDGYRAVKIIKDGEKTAGILTVSAAEASPENTLGLAVFAAADVVWAVGGPSAIYSSTVYPESQTCALGAALEAGAAGINLTESQYGLASVSPRWNVSGSYQQVLPRYVSTDADGNGEREFLGDYMDAASDIPEAIFKKGYEWPFSAAKIYSGGRLSSSALDLAVFCEKMHGRRVFLDYTQNPREIMKGGMADISLAGEEAMTYLQNCGSTGELPIERLEAMNAPAIGFYRSRGVDLYRERLEIAVCAQHCNGGIEVDKWYETRVPGLFVIGEAAGVFGVSRPGGSALNSTQVGGMRAAEKIASRKKAAAKIKPEQISGSIPSGGDTVTLSDILDRRALYAGMMTECCSFLRDIGKIRRMQSFVRSELSRFSRLGVFTPREAAELMINRDILITQAAMLASAEFYISSGGISRGSFLVTEKSPEELLRGKSPVPTDTEHSGVVLLAELTPGGDFKTSFEPCRPIPAAKGKYWFETVYREYISGGIYGK